MYEYIGNPHNHSPFSDGAAYHDEIAHAARLAGLDFVIVTDHNIRVGGVEGYYGAEGDGYVLLLTGEEIHNRYQQPLGNHCLVYGVAEEMAPHAHHPQALLDEIQAAGGLSFLAHPTDTAITWHNDSVAIPWRDWDVQGFHGLEVWNYMSSFKRLATTPWQTLKAIFAPEDYVTGPDPQTLALWDKLLAEGQRVVGIGGADGHGREVKLGPLTHTVFHYDFLFHCVNTHILTPVPLAGQLDHDRTLIYRALAQGRAFISYGILGSARGFRFTAQGGKGGTRIAQGGNIRLGHGVTLQALVPRRAHMKLIHNGRIVLDETNVENVTYVAQQPGAYRVEVWSDYKGQERCWILSNPIYVEPNLGSMADNA